MKPYPLAQFNAPLIVFNFKKREWERVLMQKASASFTLSIRDITDSFPGGRIELNATVNYNRNLFLINISKWDLLEMLRINLMLRPIRRQSKKNLSIDAPELLKKLVPPEQYPQDIVEKIWKEYEATEIRQITSALLDPTNQEAARLQLDALDRRRQAIEAVYPILPSGYD